MGAAVSAGRSSAKALEAGTVEATLRTLFWVGQPDLREFSGQLRTTGSWTSGDGSRRVSQKDERKGAVLGAVGEKVLGGEK
jgi:hypothetical protein